MREGGKKLWGGRGWSPSSHHHTRWGAASIQPMDPWGAPCSWGAPGSGGGCRSQGVWAGVGGDGLGGFESKSGSVVGTVRCGCVTPGHLWGPHQHKPRGVRPPPVPKPHLPEQYSHLCLLCNITPQRFPKQPRSLGEGLGVRVHHLKSLRMPPWAQWHSSCPAPQAAARQRWIDGLESTPTAGSHLLITLHIQESLNFECIKVSWL